MRCLALSGLMQRRTPSEDHIALLDDLHTLPLGMFQKADRPKLFTLSQVGFYLFVVKLSIHFCRFSEGISRD
jgi:hypothetical protein